MRSTNGCIASGMANTDDGACWETVLRFLQTPTPADYSFEFEERSEEEVQQPEENLLVDEYLFKRPHFVPRQTIYSSRNQKLERKKVDQKLEWKKVVDATKSDDKIINPAKFLKLTEIEMVQSLRRWTQVTHDSTIAHPVSIKEADVYALHPADLISDSCSHYFYSATKYSCLKRPTRLRITQNGCRWKQQGRIFPIRENGQTVAYKTYLSYVALKNGNNLIRTMPSTSSAAIDGTSTSKDMVCKRRDRKWSLWTMEEIGLAEDIQSERIVLRRGGRPRPFPVICRIVCKRDGITATASQPRVKCKKPTFRRDFSQVAEPKPSDADESAAVSAEPMIDLPVTLVGNTSSLSSSTSAGMMSLASSSSTCMMSLASSSSTCMMSPASSSSARMMNAQDILEDEIIRALIYELPYRKVASVSSTC